MPRPFVDGVYSSKLVDAINRELDSAKDAFTMWESFHRHLWEIEGLQGLCTAPREFLLCLMDERRVPQMPELAAQYGFICRYPVVGDVENAYNYAVEQWCNLGWQLDDQGWHAPDGWKDMWGSPNEDFYPSAEEFARVRSEIDGI